MPEAAADTGASQTLLVLRNRNFLPYLVGNLVSSTGAWFQTVAQALVVYQLTHSAFLLGVVGFSQFAAVFVLAPWTGPAADRFDRRRVVIASQAVAMVVTTTLTLVAAFGNLTTPIVIVFAAMLGVTSAFSTPAMMAFVPSLVEPRYLSTALALNSVTFNIGRSVGPICAAAVVATLGTTWAFGINACSYLGLIVGMLLVHPLTPQTRPAERPRLRQSIRLVMEDKRLAALLYVIAAANLATDPPATLGPAYMSQVLGHSPSVAGVLIGAFGIGAVVCASTISHRLRGSRNGIAASLGTIGGGLVVYALAPGLWVALVALFVMGYAYLATNTGATTRLQLDVAPEMRGRIMGLWSIAFLGIRPIGSLVDGAIASWIGLREAAFLMALPAVAGPVGILLWHGRWSRAPETRAVPETPGVG